jgi:hypothetical protein
MSSVNAKRKAPASVSVVEHAGVRYLVEPYTIEDGERKNAGVITAQDIKTGTEIWSITVYVVDRQPGLESDVQDVFINALSIDADKNLLIVKNERGHTYWVDLKKRVSVHVL